MHYNDKAVIDYLQSILIWCYGVSKHHMFSILFFLVRLVLAIFSRREADAHNNVFQQNVAYRISPLAIYLNLKDFNEFLTSNEVSNWLFAIANPRGNSSSIVSIKAVPPS